MNTYLHNLIEETNKHFGSSETGKQVKFGNRKDTTRAHLDKCFEHNDPFMNTYAWV